MTTDASRTPRTAASRYGRVIATVAVLCGVFAPQAQAGLLVESAGSCAEQPLERPFLRWLDPFSYTLVPGGAFEGEATGWTLAGSSVGAGNEPFLVRSRTDSGSLSLPAGSSATSATLCVGLFHPTMRFFARSSGGSLLSTLQVDVLFETASGQVASLPIGVVPAYRNWQPTLPAPVIANLLPLLPGAQTPVAFRFTPRGSANWTIDDVYVDPKRR